MTTPRSDFSEYYAIETVEISKHFGAVKAVDEAFHIHPTLRDNQHRWAQRFGEVHIDQSD